MNVAFDLLCTAAPLLVVAAGALISEFAGIMAVFADGFINLGSFLCYVVAVKTDSLLLGSIASTLVCSGFALVIALFTKLLRANPFITGLSLNVMVSGLVSLLSVQLFGTRGILASSDFTVPRADYMLLVCGAWFIAILAAGTLAFTKAGLYIRMTGGAPDVLAARGVRPERLQAASWCVAGGCAAFSGCILVAELSSFVPNMSAGRGWTALAAVFLGRKKIRGVGAAVLVFTLAEYASNNLQRIPLFANVPTEVLLALPYLAALVLIGLDFSKKNE